MYEIVFDDMAPSEVRLHVWLVVLTLRPLLY